MPFDESKSKEVYDSIKSIREYYKQKYVEANTCNEDISGFYSETYDLDENGNKQEDGNGGYLMKYTKPMDLQTREHISDTRRDELYDENYQAAKDFTDANPIPQ